MGMDLTQIFGPAPKQRSGTDVAMLLRVLLAMMGKGQDEEQLDEREVDAREIPVRPRVEPMGG